MGSVAIPVFDLTTDVQDHSKRDKPAPNISSTNSTENAEARNFDLMERGEKGSLFVYLLPKIWYNHLARNMGFEIEEIDT